MPPISRRAFTGLTLAGMAASVAGCTGITLLPAAPQLYTLTPKNTFDPTLPNVEWQLLVEPPIAPAGLDTARIPVRDSPVTLDYYAGVAWPDRVPPMVQTLLIQSFENTGRIISVGRDAVGLRADYLLKTELRDFQADYSGRTASQAETAPTAVVRMNAKLVSFPAREIIAGENFEAREPAASPRFEDIILAYDEALGKVMRRLVEWTLVQGEFHWRNRPRRSI